MSALLSIPSATASQIAATGLAPLLLAKGELTLNVIPANPPSHPSETITLSIGTASFPLLPNTPLQRVRAKEEHASYLFTPLALDGGAGVGQVLIQMKNSSNQGEWEATEALCRKLEETLKSRHLWDEKVHFVNDEYDTAGVPVKGWGDTVAGAVTGGASFIAAKIASIADTHLGATNTSRSTLPTHTSSGSSATLVNDGSTRPSISSRVSEAGRNLVAQLPPSVQKLAEPTPEHEKSDIRKAADEGWEQVTIAAKGIAGAAGMVGKSVSDSTQRAVEANFGKATSAAGQSSASIPSAALSSDPETSATAQGPAPVGVHQG